MSTLQKAVSLLQDMPEKDLENAYMYLLFMKEHSYAIKDEKQLSAFGIAHKYANLNLIDKEKEAFQNAIQQKHAFD